MSHKLTQALFLPMLLAAAGAPVQAQVSSVQPEIALADEQVGADVGQAIATLPQLDRAPTEIGPYRLIRELGTGGMGTVYLAHSTEHAGRQVALKVIRHGLTTPALLAQFEVERRALAATNHDHIARLYESGTTDDGRPWFAMEYVSGEPITAFADRRQLSLEQRLELFVDVCEAVQHLHDRGILHNDLKPENILVSERRGRRVPKIIDLGLAHVNGRGHDDPDSVAGTLAYMAPERFALRSTELDERSDVFSLGVILCELLVGAPPAGAMMQAAILAGMSTAGLWTWDRASTSPSACLRALGPARSEIARRRGTSAWRLRLRLRGALDRVARGAIEPRRENRFASAGELASQVERDVHSHAGWTRFLATGTWISATAAAGYAIGSLVASTI